MRRRGILLQTKEQGKSLEKDLNETEINNLLEKEFKIMVIKKLTDLGRRMYEHGNSRRR